MKTGTLKNMTEDIIILETISMADSFLSRFRGLMGKRELEEGRGLVISPCNSVHCFFMKFAIDVAFVDQNNRVCHLITDMRPGKVSPIVRKAKYVIETNAFALTGKLQVGHEVKIL